jgi:2-polyprenyl-6-hydroxyphenyl methylase/3-demethylubiquinone-9 3-methyltransferase
MNVAGETVTKEYLREVVRRDQELDTDREVHRLLLKLSKVRAPQEGDTLLDVGCGTGALTAALRRHGINATGMDVVPEFVNIAHELHPSGVFLVGEAERLPFASDSFTFVTLASVLEHVRDWRLALAEAARVLAPGGVLYLHTSNRLWPFQAEIRYFPGFGYLPGVVQRRIYRLAMTYRPALVGHTHLPAYHWLTWWRVAKALRDDGLEPRSWITLMRREDLPPRYRRFGWLLSVIRRSPVALYPFVPIANVVLAWKPSR